MATPLLYDEHAVAQAQACDSLGALLALDDAEFVASAYLSLLRRPADPDGLAHYTRKLRAGHTRHEVLDLMLASREGRSKAAQLRGLSKGMAQYRLSRLPLIGALVRYFGHFEGHSARDRHLRAIEQSLQRQELRNAHQQWQMLQELQGLRQAIGTGGVAGGGAAASQNELIVQPKGQTPSVLSRFIQLERATADEVIEQFAEIVRTSLEAEQLAGARQP
jgi:hypothetical protein